MNDKQKIVTFLLALICNFTFLLTAQIRPAPAYEAKKLPEYIQFRGPDSPEIGRNLAYFLENLKSRDYAKAYIYWSYVFQHAPCACKTIYLRGPDLLHFMINHSRSDEERFRLVDTLFIIFTARIKYFGEETLVNNSRAYSLSKYKPEKSDEILFLHHSYFSQQKDRFDWRYMKDYMHNAIIAHKNNSFNKDQLCALYKYHRDTAESYRIKTSENRKLNTYWACIITELDEMMTDYIICSDNYRIYQPQFKIACIERSIISVTVNSPIERSRQKIMTYNNS